MTAGCQNALFFQWRAVQGLPASIGHEGEVVEEFFAFVFRQHAEDMALEFDRDFAGR